MRVALLAHRDFRDVGRAALYAAALAQKHPDAIVLSCGDGSVTYAVERAALDAGLRVAAFRVGCPPPGVETSRKVWDHEMSEEEETRTRRRESLWLRSGENGPRPTPRGPIRLVELYELRPGVERHRASLWHPDPRVVARVRGEAEAEAEALQWALHQADHVVAFTADREWPPVASVGAAVHYVGGDR